MTWTLFRGNRLFPSRKLSRGFSLLPSLVVMLSVSAALCSVVSSKRAEIAALEKARSSFEESLDGGNEDVEGDWFDVAF